MSCLIWVASLHDKIWPLKAASDIRKFEEISTHSAAPKLAIGESLLFHNGIGGKRKEARLRQTFKRIRREASGYKIILGSL